MEGGGGGAGGGEDRSGAPAPAPIAAPAPTGGPDGTSQTNVQEAGVDEPDWVKAVGTTLYVAQDGKLRSFDVGGDQPRALGAVDVPGNTQELLVRGDRALVISTIGYGGPVPLAAQVPGVPSSRWLGGARLLEVDISDPARLRVLRELDVEGSYLGARLTGTTARVIVRTEPRGLERPDLEPSDTPDSIRRDWSRSVRRTRTRAWLPSAVVRDRRKGTKRRRALVRCRQVRRTQAFSGLGTVTVLTIDLSGSRPAFPVADADALMIDGDTVYASRDRLYVASQRWLEPDATRAEILDESATGLHAFSTDTAGETGYVGSGEVPGYLLNQWSLSEHEGTLRAATT